jgi:hypothetical protein
MPELPTAAGPFTAVPLKRVAAYLRCIGDPDGGEPFFHLHAAQAPVRHEDGLRAAAQLDAAGFDRAHRAHID